MPATDCDLDHIDPWARTGTTDVDSLASTCRHDHVGRHKFDWRYRPTHNGDYVWVSRLGQVYTTSGIPPPKRS
ncbi:MAG: HNH endonuclease [Acidimicrobiia bacterium]|nr:HNH endonuclease [Acidimicrobiia bacterium]